jgi:hypothetical protein
MNNAAEMSGFPSADRIMNAIKKNPEGLLLLAAGCALLFRSGSARRSGSSRRDFRSNVYDTHAGAYGQDSTERTRQEWEMPEGISQAAEGVREYAASVRDTVSETARNYSSAAGEYAQQASQYAQQAGETLRDRSGRFAEQTQHTMENVVRQQPVAVAVAGLAAGAAIATLFPATRVEREALGPAAARLAEAATGAREKLSEAASAAGDRLMAAAKERGVSPEGFKEVARDVAGTFEKSLSGHPQEEGRSGQQKATSGVRSPATSASPAGTGAGTTAQTTGPAGSPFSPNRPPNTR